VPAEHQSSSVTGRETVSPDLLSVEYPGSEETLLAGKRENKRCFDQKSKSIMASEVYFT